MKKYLLACIALIILHSMSLAQYVDIYLISESVDKVTSNSELIASDALVIDNYINLPGGSDLYDRPPDDDGSGDPGSETDWDPEQQYPRFPGSFGLGAETVLTPTSKFLRLPLSYHIGDLSLNLSVPFYYRRTMVYAHGRESTSGLGDMQIKAMYRLSGSFFHTRFIANLKLPTGDANKQTGGYLVPLGTGTTDILLGNVFLTAIGPVHLSNSMSYRISGSHTRHLEIYYPFTDVTEQVRYSVNNGNTFLLNSAASYPTVRGLIINAGWSLIANSKGSVDKYHQYSNDRTDLDMRNASAGQDFLFLDINAGVSYRFLGTEFMLNLIQPVITSRSVSSGEGDRGFMYVVKISRNIL